MTAAQKIAKEKFKKAIAIRSKTGVSLKEAFAQVYGKKKALIKKAATNVKKLVDKAKKAYREGYNEAALKSNPLMVKKSKVGVVKKKAAKKVVKKAAPKKAAKKVVQKNKPRYSATKHTNFATIPQHRRRVNGVKTHKDTKSHNVNIRVVSGIDKTKRLQNQEVIKKYNDTKNEISKQEQYLINWNFALKSNKGFPANIKIIKVRISEIKKLISELKTHATQLKKLI
jgi:hypothetical protein